MAKNKYRNLPVPRQTYDEMLAYSLKYGISLANLGAAMWRLYSALDQARQTGIFPEPPRDSLDESLETFLDEMQAEADGLDEGYGDDDPLVTPAQERERAIAAYQELHVWLDNFEPEIRL